MNSVDRYPSDLRRGGKVKKTVILLSNRWDLNLGVLVHSQMLCTLGHSVTPSRLKIDQL